MDRIVDYLSSYTLSLEFDDIPKEVVHKAKQLWIDTLACSLGGYASEPAKVAREMAGTVQSSQAATILWSGVRSSVDLAIFANGIMVRYLDYNDFYQGPAAKVEGGHPSTTFPSVLATAELSQRDGKALILGSVLTAEVYTRLVDAASLRVPGFDHSTYNAIAAACGASKMLGLSKAETAQAIALATVANLGLSVSRFGSVSMWRLCAAANASRNGVFATLLAARGITGPLEVFEGKQGLFSSVTGEFQLEPFGGDGQPFRIMQSSVRHYPCGSLAQTAIECALTIRPKLSSPEEIEQVRIRTFEQPHGLDDIPEKWHPQSKETAELSMPYVVGVALMFGGVEVHHFSDEFLHNPELLDLVQKVKLEAAEECSSAYPEQRLNIVEIVTKSGQRFEERLGYHKGHPKNPLTDEEVEQKFHSLAKGLLTERKVASILESLWNLEQEEDVGRVVGLMKVGV